MNHQFLTPWNNEYIKLLKLLRYAIVIDNDTTISKIIRVFSSFRTKINFLVFFVFLFFFYLFYLFVLLLGHSIAPLCTVSVCVCCNSLVELISCLCIIMEMMSSV